MPGVSPQRGAVRNVVQGASAGSAADPASDLRNIMIPMWFRVRSACMKRPRANDRRELITSVLALVMAAWRRVGVGPPPPSRARPCPAGFLQLVGWRWMSRGYLPNSAEDEDRLHSRMLFRT